MRTKRSQHSDPEKAQSPIERALIAVDPKVIADFEEIRKALGSPLKLTLATQVIIHVARQVKAGEVEMVNGELRRKAA